MKRRRKTVQTPAWDLPEWQIQVLLKALSDHELVLKLREQGGYPYRVMLDQIRQNLHAKLAAPGDREAQP